MELGQDARYMINAAYKYKLILTSRIVQDVLLVVLFLWSVSWLAIISDNVAYARLLLVTQFVGTIFLTYFNLGSWKDLSGLTFGFRLYVVVFLFWMMVFAVLSYIEINRITLSYEGVSPLLSKAVGKLSMVFIICAAYRFTLRSMSILACLQRRN